jgi:hypothetical protein
MFTSSVEEILALNSLTVSEIVSVSVQTVSQAAPDYLPQFSLLQKPFLIHQGSR